jgi:hypothetical protein
MNYELGRMIEVVVFAYIKVLSQHLPEGTE